MCDKVVCVKDCVCVIIEDCVSKIVCDKVVCVKDCVCNYRRLCVKDCVWQSCVSKIVCDGLCVKDVKDCAWQSCVWKKVAEADGGGGADGIQNQKKNKNPTQKCGEKSQTELIRKKPEKTPPFRGVPASQALHLLLLEGIGHRRALLRGDLQPSRRQAHHQHQNLLADVDAIAHHHLAGSRNLGFRLLLPYSC